MKREATFFKGVLLAVVVASSGCQPSGSSPEASSAKAIADPAPAEPAVQSAQNSENKGPSRSAVFAVQGLKDDAVKPLVNALAGVEGVLSAKPDVAAGQLIVSFEEGRTDAETLLTKLRAVRADVSLDGAAGSPELAEPAAHKCGGCPFRNSCGKAHQEEDF